MKREADEDQRGGSARGTQSNIADLEGGGRGHRQRKWRPPEAEGGEEMGSPSGLQKEHSPANTLILAQ